MRSSNRVIQRGISYTIASTAVWTIFLVATTGPVLSGLFIALGFSNLQIGLVNSMLSLFLPFQIIGSLIQQKYFKRKSFWFGVTTLHYSSFLLIFILLCLWQRLDAGVAAGLFIFIFALSQLAVQLGSSVWFAWMGDLVPPRESNQFWSRRAGVSQVFMIGGAISAGLIVDFLGRREIMTYAWLFGVGAVCGFVAMFLQMPAVDPEQRLSKRIVPALLKLRMLWRNSRFRRLTLFFCTQAFFSGLFVPFVFIYMQKQLGFTMLVIQLLMAVASITAFFSAFLFRVVGSKYGRKPIIILCTFLKGLEFILWGMLLPGSSWMTALPVIVLGGFVNIGLISTQFSLITSIGTSSVRSFSIGVFFAVNGLLAFTGASVSGIVYDLLDIPASIFGRPVSAFNLMSLIVSAGYFASILVFLKFREYGSLSTTRVVRILLANNPFRTVYHAHALSRPMPERDRIEALSKVKSNIIASELINDLYSPSSRVRESAVYNISRLGKKVDPVLEDELITLLDIPALGLQDAAARALGYVSSGRAVPALEKHLSDTDDSLVQACIFALGSIGDEHALEMLTAIMDSEQHRRKWPQAAEAIGKIGDCRHTRKIYNAYEFEYSPVLKRQCMIALLRTLCLTQKRKSWIYSLFEEETQSPGGPVERIMKSIQSRLQKKLSAPERILFAKIMDDNDSGDFCAGVEKLMMILFRRMPLPEPETSLDPDKFLEEMRACFSPNGTITESTLQQDTFLSAAIWLMLKIWLEMKYNSSPFDNCLNLAFFIIADEILARDGKNFPVAAVI